MLGRQTRLAMRIVAISLVIVAMSNMATVGAMFELRIAMKYVYINMVSWGIVWLSGLLIAVLSIDEDRPSQ